MSHCREFEEAFAEVAEGRPLSAEAEAHLRSCESCRRSARWLSLASQGFEALRSVQAPDPRVAVWARVARPKRRPAFAFAWATGVALCALVSALIFLHAPVAPTPPGGPAAAGSADRQGPQTVEVAEPPAPEETVKVAVAPPRSSDSRVSSSQPSSRRRHRLRPHPTMIARTVSREKPAAETRVGAGSNDGAAPAVAEGACSETAALAYRAIGRALVMRFMERNGPSEESKSRGVEEPEERATA